jgi:hypothetical protein
MIGVGSGVAASMKTAARIIRTAPARGAAVLGVARDPVFGFGARLGLRFAVFFAAIALGFVARFGRRFAVSFLLRLSAMVSFPFAVPLDG